MAKEKRVKPVNVVPPMMEEQIESQQAFKEIVEAEETIADFLFQKGREEGIRKSYKTIRNCTFRSYTLFECILQSTQLSDVRFENCDLSNVSFASSSLYRVEFIGCKLLGTNFSKSSLNHVLMHECTAGYINLSMSKINQVRLSNCQFRNGSFNDCRLSSLAINGCDLIEADFLHTPLQGIDLRTSQISGISLNINDLRGAIITSVQAIDLLPLLGVVIED